MNSYTTLAVADVDVRHYKYTFDQSRQLFILIFGHTEGVLRVRRRYVRLINHMHHVTYTSVVSQEVSARVTVWVPGFYSAFTSTFVSSHKGINILITHSAFPVFCIPLSYGQ